MRKETWVKFGWFFKLDEDGDFCTKIYFYETCTTSRESPLWPTVQRHNEMPMYSSTLQIEQKTVVYLKAQYVQHTALQHALIIISHLCPWLSRRKGEKHTRIMYWKNSAKAHAMVIYKKAGLFSKCFKNISNHQTASNLCPFILLWHFC